MASPLIKLKLKTKRYEVNSLLFVIIPLHSIDIKWNETQIQTNYVSLLIIDERNKMFSSFKLRMGGENVCFFMHIFDMFLVCSFGSFEDEERTIAKMKNVP